MSRFTPKGHDLCLSPRDFLTLLFLCIILVLSIGSYSAEGIISLSSQGTSCVIRARKAIFKSCPEIGHVRSQGFCSDARAQRAPGGSSLSSFAVPSLVSLHASGFCRMTSSVWTDGSVPVSASDGLVPF